ncbi:MAG: hypothetical protein EXS01_03220, partial [Phycisphaerales bacterium]|nr:hypothetical protein [Phycisphaerales bacterium]
MPQPIGILHFHPIVALLLVISSTRGASAQELRDVPITGGSLGGFVLPIEPVVTDIFIDAVRGWAWTVDDTKRLQIEGDVRVRFGGYNFSSTNAVIWINRIPSSSGLITQIAVYFPEAEEPTRRAGLGASGSDLLVTGSTRGEVSLSLTVIEDRPAPLNPILVQAESRVKAYLESIARGALLRSRPQLDAPIVPVDPPLRVGGSVEFSPAKPALSPETVRVAVDESRIFSPKGTISFSAGSTTIESKDDCVMLSGSVRVDYASPPGVGKLKELQLSADRAVIFLA